MSTNLPPFPNFEHLRKQAKVLLASMREQNPATKLSDAQFAIARRYGFESWPKLKRYVDELPSRIDGALARHEGPPSAMDPALVPPDGRFARYTVAAQRVIFRAYRSARKRGSPTIEPRDLLIGLLEEPDSHLRNVLECASVRVESLRTAVDETFTGGEEFSGLIIPPDPSFTRAVELGTEEADRLKHAHIGTPHLLLGIARVGGSAAETLKPFGLTAERIREAFGRSVDR